MDKENTRALYAEHLAPLMEQVQQRAQELGLPFQAAFFDGERGQEVIQMVSSFPAHLEPTRAFADLAEVRGQEAAKRALEVAAAGGHNVLLYGSAGVGKVCLARALPSLVEADLSLALPFRTPHHSLSQTALLEEVKLAQGGVLMLEHLAAYAPSFLHTLCQARHEQAFLPQSAEQATPLPARVQVVATLEPCLCGYYGDILRECTCSAEEILDYHRRVQDILDGFDLFCEVPPVDADALLSTGVGETSTAVRARVQHARLLQAHRFEGTTFACNAHMQGLTQVQEACSASPTGKKLLKAALQQLHFSPRELQRTLLVARSIADLAGDGVLEAHHLAEAIQYRPSMRA